MRIGIKMAAEWRQQPQWRTVAPDFPCFLASLKNLGIRSVEFSLCNQQVASDPVVAAAELVEIEKDARTIIRAGLRVHLHPYAHVGILGASSLSAETREQVVNYMHRLIGTAGELAACQQAPVNVVFHAAEDLLPGRSESELTTRRKLLFNRSRAYFRMVADRIEATAPRINVFCEHVPTPKEGIRIGDRPEELYELIRNPNFKLCWDTGHYAISAACLGFPSLPGKFFLDLVGHVHLHGLDNGKDHQPVAPQDPYLNQCLQLMQAIEFAGPVTLEHPYGNRNGSSREAILQTISRAVETISPVSS